MERTGRPVGTVFLIALTLMGCVASRGGGAVVAEPEASAAARRGSRRDARMSRAAGCAFTR